MVGIYMKRWQKKVVINGMAYFYIAAGLNHFIAPHFYLDLIPPFFSQPELVNLLAGIAELLLGLGIIFYPTRKRSALGVIFLLLAFIPSHVYFIQIGSCIEGGLCVPEWVGWVRLLVIHPVLIIWAYWVAKNTRIYG